MKLYVLFLESDESLRRLERAALQSGDRSDWDRLEQARARLGRSDFDMQYLKQWREIP